MDTIFALSSGAAPAAIGVVRVSGPAAQAAGRAVAGRLPMPRRAGLRVFRDAAGAAIDTGLVLVFPAPASATGEDLVEFHCHGGRAVIRALEAALAAVPGCRPAQPGEFTRRALLNGRIDVTTAEGLADLLAADTERARRAAILASEGAIRVRVEAWTDRVLAFSAAIEAALDYADEADVAEDAAGIAAVRTGLAALAGEMAAVLRMPPVERLRDGIRVVLVGPPNAGKSSLLNALVGREAAIVSPLAGTTRDRIEAPVEHRGIAYLFTDTAGLTEAPRDIVEEAGIVRARAAAAAADIILWLDDAPPGEPDSRLLRVHARADLPERRSGPADAIACSARTGEGLAALWEAIAARAEALVPPADQPAFNARQRALCETAVAALEQAGTEQDVVLLAEGLRAARRALDRITGRADVEAVLDTLFARFCIGK